MLVNSSQGLACPKRKGTISIVFHNLTIYKQGEVDAVVIASGVNTFLRYVDHLVDSTNQVGHFQKLIIKKIQIHVPCMRLVKVYFYVGVRVNFFRGISFSLAWWEYTFPMTGAAVAMIRYTSEVSNIVTKLLSVGLTSIATLTVFGLLVTTILHAFVMRDHFPNDIAISDRKPKTVRKWFHRRAGSSEKDIEHYLKYVTSNEKDVVEASVTDKDVKSQTPLP
ncbi:putative voltage-dependent anion channel [Helianthus annuus]|uniref:Voltage-dependent anion channel n=1 Tax=Helianthus annuus TaxID=4232 RepID=A0A9K3JP96_HELAN|nr:putative voltage-dependent anion channel [Helianthus annuus]KAJ0604530.1 putative transporter protein SLAC1/Mae1/ Ssu1/TehA [Helianthus annuus]